MIKHGIVDWTFVNKQNIQVPYSSSEKRVPSIWEMMDEHGLRSVVLNWFVTYPPDAVRGVMVSDSFAAGRPEGPFGKGRSREPWPIRSIRRRNSRKLYEILPGLSAAGALQYPRLVGEMKIPDYLAEYKSRYAAEPKRIPILSVWPSFLAYDRIQDTLVDHYLEEDESRSLPGLLSVPGRILPFRDPVPGKEYHDRIDAYVGGPVEPTPEVLEEFNRRWPRWPGPSCGRRRRSSRRIVERAPEGEGLSPGRFGPRVPDVLQGLYALRPSGGDPAARRNPHARWARTSSRASGSRRLSIDIAPTILYLKGLPVGADMDGKPLLEALTVPGPSGPPSTPG